MAWEGGGRGAGSPRTLNHFFRAKFFAPLFNASAKELHVTEVAEASKDYGFGGHPSCRCSVSMAYETSRFSVDDLVSFFQPIDDSHK